MNLTWIPLLAVLTASACHSKGSALPDASANEGDDMGDGGSPMPSLSCKQSLNDVCTDYAVTGDAAAATIVALESQCVECMGAASTSACDHVQTFGGCQHTQGSVTSTEWFGLSFAVSGASQVMQLCTESGGAYVPPG